jgi:transcriptional regulator with XRE-family HTH domain
MTRVRPFEELDLSDNLSRAITRSSAFASYTTTFNGLAPKGEPKMVICDRLRELRESKNLSQRDIEKRTGLLCCYISRVENGHTVPAIETLEKLARALEVPLYQLFYNGDKPPQLPNLLKRKTSEEIAWGSSGKDAIYLHKLRKRLSRAAEGDRKILLSFAQKMAGRNRVAQTSRA